MKNVLQDIKMILLLHPLLKRSSLLVYLGRWGFRPGVGIGRPLPGFAKRPLVFFAAVFAATGIFVTFAAPRYGNARVH